MKIQMGSSSGYFHKKRMKQLGVQKRKNSIYQAILKVVINPIQIFCGILLKRKVTSESVQVRKSSNFWKTIIG
jgi:hypothetical protein